MAAQEAMALRTETVAPPVLVPEINRAPISRSELLAARPTMRELVANVLYADLRLRVAAGGVGKTTLALFEAITVALGRPLYGAAPPHALRTVIITAEDSRELLVARAFLIMQAMGLNEAEQAQVLENVAIWDVSNAPLRLCWIAGDVVEPHADNIAALGDWLSEFAPDWVIFDPCVSFGVGEGRTNDAEQGIVTALRILRNRLNCCVEIIHHSGKANARDKTTDQYTGRGGSALPDGCRMVAVLVPMDAGEFLKETGQPLLEGESATRLSLPKMSYAPPRDDIVIRRRGYAFEQVAVKRMSPEQQKAELEARVMAFIRADYAQGITHSKAELEDQLDLIGITRAQLRASLARLVAAGLLDPESGSRNRRRYIPITPPASEVFSEVPK